MQLHPRLAAILVVAAILSAPAFGQIVTYTWHGGASSVMSTGANWVGGNPPPSNSATTALVFPAAGNSYVAVTGNIDVNSLTFSGSYPPYYFATLSENQYTIGVGSGGITAGAGPHTVTFGFGVRLQLLAHQTWNIATDITVYDAVTGSYSLTKTGAGSLALLGSFSGNTFSGGLDVQEGSVYINGTSFAEGSTIFSGPVGTGTLTLRSGTTLAVDQALARLDNPVTLYSGVTFAAAESTQSLRLHGPITLQSTSTTINIQGEGATYFQGAIGQASGGTSVTFTGGLAVLSGANTYAGSTTANAGRIVFGSSGSLATTSSVGAINGGYTAVTYDGGMTTLLGKVTSPSTFNGTLGFDTTSEGSLRRATRLNSFEATTFTDAINLLSFDPTKLTGIGTFSTALLTGSISPVGSGDYKFGGGNGTLFVQSNLGPVSTAGLTAASSVGLDGNRFTLALTGTNTFTGGISVTGSNLILNSNGALPTGVSINLGAYGYAGYTEDAASTLPNFSTFYGRVTESGKAATGIVGLDTANTEGVRTVADAINLSGRTPVYLGTATRVNVTGTITPPTGGTVFLTGVNDGYLKITSALLASSSVSGVKIGYANSEPTIAYRGFVELTNSSSNYTGNTILESGYLLVGASSVMDGPILSGPIGRGTLVVSAASNNPALVASVNGVTLHNPISLLGSGLQIGTNGFTSDQVNGFAGHSLTLAGVISGTGHIGYESSGGGTLTLSGANTFSGGFTASGYNDIVANSNTAFGTGKLAINGPLVTFTTAAPVIGGLEGFGVISLASGSTLQINQQQEGSYFAAINGTGVTITKTGTAPLILGGNGTYTGTTNINQGTIMVVSSTSVVGPNTVGPFGESTIVLGGGQLQLLQGVTISNPITFSAPSRLTGSGTFSGPVTVGTNATLAPGMSPGTMTFASGLTFSSGGTFEVEIQSTTPAPGTSNDTLSITGALTFSTPTTPFQLNLLSLGSNGSPGAVADFSNANSYSWVIASTTGGLSGFSGANLAINASGFTNPLNGGFFSLSESGTNLVLNFTAVPEPSTYALLLCGLGVVVWTALRRRAGRQ